jgi:hypothetical protein
MKPVYGALRLGAVHHRHLQDAPTQSAEGRDQIHQPFFQTLSSKGSSHLMTAPNRGIESLTSVHMRL